MPYFFYYLLKVIICSGVLYGYYALFLRNKIYHGYNRYYLLATVFIALLCPLVNYNLFLDSEQTTVKPIQMLQVVTNGNTYVEDMFLQPREEQLNLTLLLSAVYFIVSLLFLFILLRILSRIFFILKTSSGRKLNDIIFIQSDSKGTPFSFFRFIFWNSAIDINSPTGQQVFAHELAHVRENHSADKLFLNIVLIPFWINPFFWLARRELNLIHEFIADKKAVANHDSSALAAMIVTSTYPKHAHMLTNHFFYSPIKRRLLMLSKYNSRKAGYFYRVLSLPVILFLVAAISIKAKTRFSGIVNPAEKITVVIDAGHGGQDGGAMSSDGKIKEKNLALEFISAIKAQNKASNINLVFTRENDLYQTPQEKAAVAKKANADLFISVHVASQAENEGGLANGLEIFVSKTENQNSQPSKLFASAVLQQFRGNYGISVPSNPVQRKTGIYVLQANECPSILIEAGYMTNAKDLAYLQSDEAKKAFARNLLAAIARYAAEKKSGSLTEKSFPIVDTVPKASAVPKYYKGEKIKSIKVQSVKEEVIITLENGKKVTMSMEEADACNLLPPPPPPAKAPPPPPPPPAPAKVAPLPPPPPIPAVAPLPPLPPAPPAPPVKNNNDQQKNVELRLNNVNTVNSNINTLQSAPVAVRVHPTVILDGLEIEYAELVKINPDEISSINVLKGENAVKKYGEKKSVNGVIEVNTKAKVNVKAITVNTVNSNTREW